MRRLSIAIWISAMGASSLLAQRYNFKFYGEEQGLQNLAVQVVLQDRDGFLWAGTQNGLYRYDGNRFTAFSKGEGLPAARIESLHESVDGTLWVGTRTGVARRVGEHFETIPLAVAEGVIGREGIGSDRDGRIYLATERGLVIGTPDSVTADTSGASPSNTTSTGTVPTGVFRFVLVPRPQHVTRDEVDSVYVDSSGEIWYGCADGLCRLEQGHGREVGGEQGLPPDRWEALLTDLDGNFWVRSERALFLRPSGTRRFQARTGLPDSSNTYPTLALDPVGRLLAPTFRGLARQTGNGWELIQSEEGLTTNDISSVMQDREGSIWVGLLGSGLARWLGYNEWESWSQREGLTRESIWSIARDRGGRLWVGTQFGLNYAEERDGKLFWRSQPVEGVEMIRALAPSPDGSLWIGGDPGGLHQLDPRTGRTRAMGAAEGLTGGNVRHVMVDRDGYVWVSTRTGVFRSTTQTTSPKAAAVKFAQQFPAGTDASETFLMSIADRHGTVWIAGDRGLARWADGKWTRFGKKDGLKSDMVAQVAEDPDGSLWIGYRDAYGVTRLTFPGRGVALEHFTTANGLHSDKSLYLGFDTHGQLWIGTDHGVDVFDHANWRHFGQSDGLIWDDANSNAFLGDADGSVWVGTSRGLSRFRRALQRPPNVPPPVVFTSVKFGDRDVSPASNLDVPYRESSLQVRFAALTFVQESAVAFRYRLGGVTPRWVETSQRELNYPKLPPGQYTLEVSARNAQGLWSTEPARLTFQILTPWWLTWWFRVAAVMVTLIFGRMLWQRRTYRLEDERVRLEVAVAQRTRELSLEKQRVLEEKGRAEQEKSIVQQQKREIERLLSEAQEASRLKSEFLANMSHEIRTPMNGVIGMTDLVLGTPLSAEQKEYLDTARLSATSLLSLLNDILDFSKIEAGRLDLNPVLFSLRQCISETQRILALAVAEKKLSFDIAIEDTVPDSLIGDPDRLRQVLMNLLGNAIKFTSSGGVGLSVRGEWAGETMTILHFAVHDTGIGIPEEKQDVIFEAFRQGDGSTTRKFGGTGLGLAISSRLVHMMDGTIHVESEPGNGATFYFTGRFGVAARFSAPQPSNGSASGESEVSMSPDVASLRHMMEAVGAGEDSEPEPAAGLDILLAEDNPVNQRLVTRLLEKRGHRVVVAATGREALARLDHHTFDLILMDVQMPDMDGLETTIFIREREKDLGTYTPIVALTAHAMKGDRELCLEAGMDDYVNKPIEADAFIKAVEATATTHARRAALASDASERSLSGLA